VEFEDVNCAQAAYEGTKSLVLNEHQIKVEYSREHQPTSNVPAWAKGGKNPERPLNIAPTFQYNKATGFWADETTGFLYDTTTQLYFHSATQVYYRWDGLKYIQVDERGVPVPTPEQAAATAAAIKKKAAAAAQPVSTDPPETSQLLAKKDKKDSKKEASSTDKKTKPVDKASLIGNIKFSLKTVNQDLVKWKKLKIEKETEKRKQLAAAVPPAAPSSSSSLSSSSSSSTTTTSSLPSVSSSTSIASSVPTPLSSSSSTTSTPTYSNNAKQQQHQPAANQSASTLEHANLVADLYRHGKHVDVNKKACLLCQRGFKSLEVLKKHCEQSELHKKNLQIEEYREIHKQQRAEQEVKARKAAAERTAQARASQFQEMATRAAEKAAEEKAKNAINTPLASDNRGSQLLKKMGWRDGEGLGKNSAGITAPIQAEVRTQGVGVGAGAASIPHGQMDSYKNTGKYRAMQRYQNSAGDQAAAKNQVRPAAAANDYLKMVAQYNSANCNEEAGNRPMLK